MPEFSCHPRLMGWFSNPKQLLSDNSWNSLLNKYFFSTSLTFFCIYQVVVGSFLPDNAPVQKPKKMKSVSAQTATPVSVQTTTPPVVTSTPKEEGVGGQGQPSSSALKPDIASPSSIQRENWASMQSMQDSRKSGTDINISLPGG